MQPVSRVGSGSSQSSFSNREASILTNVYGLKRTNDLHLSPDAGTRVVACGDDAYKVTLESIHDEVLQFGILCSMNEPVLLAAGEMSYMSRYNKQHAHFHGMYAPLLRRGMHLWPTCRSSQMNRFFSFRKRDEVLIIMISLTHVASQCIEKYIRVRKKECPKCRMHCSSKRSLRPDKRFDSKTLNDKNPKQMPCIFLPSIIFCKRFNSRTATICGRLCGN
jgi:hypothetical protein